MIALAPGRTQDSREQPKLEEKKKRQGRRKIGIDAIWSLYFRNKTRRLRNLLFLHYRYLAVSSARRYQRDKMPYRSLLDYDDLVAYAGIGLIDAIEKFDVSYNVKFETFAYYRINGAVIDGLRELQNFPRETAFLRREIAPLIESLTQVLGRTPTHDELKIYFQFVSIGDRSISDILDDPLLTASVFNQQPLRNSDDNQGEDGDNSIGCIESCLCKRRKSYVPKPYEALQRIDLISKIMKILNDDIYERTVVMCYFFMSMTSNQIAKITGLSLTWVSTKKESALRKLRIAARKDPDAFREEFLA